MSLVHGQVASSDSRDRNVAWSGPFAGLSRERIQLCYIVPSLSVDEKQHFAHLPHFLAEVSQMADVNLVVERSSGLPVLPGVKCVAVLGGRNHASRALALLRVAIRLRRRGCRTYFVRISSIAAVTLALLQRPLGLTVYYWVSGETLTPYPLELLSWYDRIAQRVSHILERAAVNWTTWFVTGPERMREYFVQAYGLQPSRVLLLYNDIDVMGYRQFASSCGQAEARRLLGLPDDRPIVLFVGRVSFLKGGAYLPEISRRLTARQPNAFLIVVGEVFLPSAREALMARDCGHVLLTGALPHRDVLLYYLAADVLIVPSVSEGCPRVLLEAMALGLPFVAFDAGGVSDMVNRVQASCVVPRGDVGTFVDRLVGLLEDAEARQRLRQAGLECVQMFDTPRIARRFVDLISNHLRPPGG